MEICQEIGENVENIEPFEVRQTTKESAFRYPGAESSNVEG